MYLTRVYLNPYKRGCRHLVASPQRLHAAVLASFPPGVLETASEGRVLWRLDRRNLDVRRYPKPEIREDAPTLTLYISSPTPPDPASLAEQAGYETEGGVLIRRIDGLLDNLVAGQVWSFRITVNPVFRKAEQLNAQGKKRPLGHVTVQQQRQWLLDRTEAHGFRILEGSELERDWPVWMHKVGDLEKDSQLLVDLVSRRIERFDRGHGRDKCQVTLQMATFEGLMTVTDPIRLRTSLANGIGRAKGYGAGLMTLARA